MKKFILLTILALSCQTKENTMLLNPLFSDGMVLQQKENVAFWGTSKPNQKVEVIGSWGTKSETTSDNDGEWILYLNTPAAGGPFNIIVSSVRETITISDVLIGEVWLAAGQSNMEMTFDYCCNTTDHSEIELSTANYPQIRMLNVKKQLSTSPTQNFEGSWEKAIGENIVGFSAAGYFFAKRLHNELKVPIGIIHASWGGTDAEAWTSRGKLNTLDFLDETMSSYDELVEESSKSNRWFSQFESIKVPSHVWYLFLEDSLGFPDKWRNLDFKDDDYIASKYDDYESWKQIELPGAFDDIYKTNDFDGAILLRKSFTLNEIKGDYALSLGPISDMDFTYVNGEKIGSNLGKASGNDKIYKIPKRLLKVGENNIVIRVLNQDGEGKVGNIALTSSMGDDISLTGKWNYTVLAEIYTEIDSFSWPYSAFYLYNKPNIDFTERPPVVTYNSNSKSALFNGMINPLIPYNIKGTIWYQGENNVQRFKEYETLFPAMISDWREKWDNDFPFYFVQIAPFHNYNGISSSLRDAQRKTLKVDKTGMVVTLDIGEVDDIHPSNKHDVGYRLAGLALKNDYEKSIIASGPLYRDFEISGNKILVNFDYVGSGLTIRQNQKSEFEIAGSDKQFFPARASVLNDRVEVFATKVTQPRHVRYGWSDTTSATLFNIEGLPASSFSSN